jgi:phage terminase large subunit-like protein
MAKRQNKIDEQRAARAINFIERICTHVKGDLAGRPFLLEDWQRAYLRELFGAVGRDGLRQYRTSFVFLPRKNGKSNLIAAIGLYLLFADGEPGAEIYVAAADREQANAIFEVQKQMVLNSPFLRGKCKIYRNSITLNGTNSYIKAISADASTKHGFSAHAVLYDELHSAPNRELWEVLSTSVGARSQPLVLGISTAGIDRGGLCRELYEYGKRVSSGAIKDNTFLPLIYEAPQDADPFSPDTWAVANPNLGVSVRMDYFQKMAAEAKVLPTSEIAFKQLHLNQWISAFDGWLTDTDWMASAGDVSFEELRGEPCYGGLDLASVSDVTALVLVFPRDDGSMKVVTRFFVSSAAVEQRRGKTGASYDQFVSRGELIVTDGNSTDYDVLLREILQLCEVFDVRSIAFDRWNSSALVQKLVEAGVDMDPFGQGFASMTQPIREMEILVKKKLLHHGGNAMLRWMVSNIQTKYDEAMNVKFVKNKSGDKIDGVVALAMAIGEYLTSANADANGSSVYETTGIRYL